MGLLVLLLLPISIILGVIMYKQTPNIDCPKCSNTTKISYTNVVKCPYCKARFTIKEINKNSYEVKDIIN